MGTEAWISLALGILNLLISAFQQATKQSKKKGR